MLLISIFTSSRYGCAPVALFDCKIEHRVSEGMDGIRATIQDEARRSQWVIIATDNDREGENIGYEIIDACKEGRGRSALVFIHMGTNLPVIS